MNKRECQTAIFNLAIKHGVSPKLITTRLLNDIDKVDMLDGRLTIDDLEANLEVWVESGMPDYASGRTIPKLTNN